MQAPILMVHGMCCTGDVWSQFRSFFEERGARVYTPTLRPEERVNRKSRPPRELSKLSLHDYVQDLEREVERIEDETGKSPAVIGHSMGGLLAQALAERDRVCAAVLLSPAVPADAHNTGSRLFWRAYGLMRRFGLTHGMIRPQHRGVSALVLNAMPAPERRAIVDAMVYESGTAFSEFAHFPIDERKIRVPLLTVAAGRDRLVNKFLVRRTSRKYAAVGGEFREYRAHGHWLYAEPGWERAASDIYDWLIGAIERGNSVRPPVVASAQL